MLTRSTFLKSAVAAIAEVFAPKARASQPLTGSTGPQCPTGLRGAYGATGAKLSPPEIILCDGREVELISMRTTIAEVKPMNDGHGGLWTARKPTGIIGFAWDGSAYWLGAEPSDKWECLRGPVEESHNKFHSDWIARAITAKETA